MKGQPSRAPELKEPQPNPSEKKPESLGRELLSIMPGIGYSIILLITFILLRPGYIGFLGIISAGQMIIWLIMKIRKKDLPKNLIKEIFKIWIIASMIYFFAKYTGHLGLAGLLLFVIAIVAYKLIIHRSAYMKALRSIEKRIWGKPLDRSSWDPGELRKTKVKLVWRKKHEK